MKNTAAVITDFGKAKDVFEYRSGLPMPEPKAGERLIRTAYAGVNPVDYKSRLGLGWGADLFRPQLPQAIIGFDFSGTDGNGRRVCGASFHGGAYAHWLCAEDEILAEVPEDVSMEQAAALPTAGTTALQLIEKAALKDGGHLLISAPLGGVGHIVMQLLKEKKLRITAICSAGKAQAARDAGADHVICYDQAPEYAGVEADVFFDLVGGEAAIAALPAVKAGGRVYCLPTIHVPALQKAGADRQLQVEGMLMTPSSQDLTTLLEKIAAGALTVNIEKILPLQKAAEAHELQETGRLAGKVLLKTA